MISIILPAHNEVDYIEETLNSIKAQDFKDYETIVVCDGCTDNTLEKVKKSADKIVVLKTRKGPATAKNEGAKMANGDFLVFLDADTKITNGLLKSIYKDKDKYTIGTTRIRPSNNKLKHKIMMTLKNYLICPLGVSNGIIFCTKENFEKYNGFPDVNKREDGFFVRELKKEGKFYISDKYVISSTRRFDKKGYIGVLFYWIKEIIKKRDEPYEIVR